MELARGAVLIAATMTMGLVAGVFGLYANTIMPGLRRTDDRTFVGAFQSIDRAIINPWFMASFFGALVLTGLAVAIVLYLIAVVITLAINVPLNDGIKAAGQPDRIGDLTGVQRLPTRALHPLPARHLRRCRRHHPRRHAVDGHCGAGTERARGGVVQRVRCRPGGLG